ncbi:dgt3 [Drosophila busckii]|uniref:Dgt3 n=1 Tax=Drosophila busckii TaxID=30019 RepID=A0A0M4EXA4_DROBS|nr:augmin complex subunit dgt3 [Drosophila busckii]ALC48317.1 dgt3 [Drosophila busckii]
MGDQLKNSSMLKKLGFDSSMQWIFYDEQFEKFFNFLADNITDANILTEQEMLECSEMIQRDEWLSESERHLKLQQIESENPGLLKAKMEHVDALIDEIAVAKEATTAYAELIEDMHNTKHSLNKQLSEQECTTASLHNMAQERLLESQTRSRQLEELQRENCRLSEEANKGFSKQQVPGLFMHQQPLDQYFLKCDSFMQYFTLYMRDNFKLQEYYDFESFRVDTQQINTKLDELQHSMQHYTIAHINEKAKSKATQALIDNIDLNKIHCLTLTDMAREAHELQLLNDNHLENTYNTLLNALTLHVNQQTQQRIELVLYENTKQKLERALRRRENDKQLTRIISDALSNAELLWISIQLDLEKARNWTDSSLRLHEQAETSWQRVLAMRSINANPIGTTGQFLKAIADRLSTHIGQQVRATDIKSCLYEYEKFGRLAAYSLHSMLNKKSHYTVHEQMVELIRLEQLLQPFVYDSPLEQPMFENIQYLCPIFKAAQQQQGFDVAVRQLRTKYMDNITERMNKDKLWRYQQLLWIWFLTEPQRVLQAIDVVKRESANVPQRLTGGLQRK